MPSPDLWKLKDTRDIYEGPLPRPLWQYDTASPDTGHPLLLLDGHSEEPMYLAIPTPPVPARWLRVSVLLTGTRREWNHWRQPQLLVRLYQGGAIVTEEGLRVHRVLEENALKNLSLDIRLNGRQPDSLVVFLRANQCPYPLRADSVQALLF